MNVCVSLSLALILSSCCGAVGSHEEEEETTTEDYDYPTVTPTPDYDYNATFDYYYVTGFYEEKNRSLASEIGQLTLLLPLGLAVLQIYC